MEKKHSEPGPKLLFVCTGNICRSPMAEGLFRHLWADRSPLLVDSAGTHGMDGYPSCTVAAEVAAGHGVNIGTLTSRMLAVEDLQRFDLILAMERGQIRHMQRLCAEEFHPRLRLVTDFAVDEFRGEEVPDPFRRAKRHYEKAWRMIAAGVEGLISELEKHPDYLSRASGAV